MNLFKRIAIVILFASMNLAAIAQEAVANEASNDLMRSNGKIFLVMTIVVLLMVGLLLYLISIDRKISKLEKK